LPSKAKSEKKIIVRSINDSKLARYVPHEDSSGKVSGIYAGRYPTSFIDAEALNPNPSITLGNSTAGGWLKDPYNQTAKNRFEDTARADKIAQSALIKKVMFVLSKQPSIRLDLYEDYATEDLEKQALASLMSTQEYRNLLVQIKQINRDVKFHLKLISADVQRRVYGRAALGIVIKNGFPTDLKLFASKNLGQVYVDPVTWKFKGVDYFDALVKKQRFPESELLYLTHLDFNITPDTLYYGLSELEGVAHDSETNRIISEEDNKEIAKSNWAPKYLLPLPGVNDAATMDAVVNGLDPSRANVINADVGQPVVLDSKGSGSEVNAIREMNDKRIIRGIDVPQPMMGYEDVTNRATLDTVMQVYHATVLDFERLMLQSQIEPQWYDTLTMQILQIKDMAKAKAHVCMEFEDLVFETWADKKDVIFGLYDRGKITGERMLKQFGLEDAIEELEVAEQQKLAKDQAQSRMNQTFAQAKIEHEAKMRIMSLTEQRLEELR